MVSLGRDRDARKRLGRAVRIPVGIASAVDPAAQRREPTPDRSGCGVTRRRSSPRLAFDIRSTPAVASTTSVEAGPQLGRVNRTLPPERVWARPA
jgi:hypothetical protein